MHSVNGIPALGFGTWLLEPPDARRMVAHVLTHGYTHVDTAQIYENEEAVGEGIADAGVAREDFHLTTKVWVKNFGEHLAPSVEESLRKLGTDYVDLLLLHWPWYKHVSMEETLDELMLVKDRGHARHIGISNHTIAQMRQAADYTGGELLTNQIEVHPFLDQRRVMAEARNLGLAVTAYSPLAQGKVFAEPTLQEIGENHSKSPGQVTLRWLIQHDGVCTIPRSSDEAHADSNLDIFDFELSEAEMEAITGLAEPDGRIVAPDGLAPEWD